MNRRQHATHARMLIAACNGLVESAGVCRIGKSQLAECQSADGETYMPADVIVALEAHCGERSYSRALFEAGSEAAQARDLADEACDAVESTADLQREIRLAVKDGKLTPGEIRRLTERHAAATAELAQVGEVLARNVG